jgi:hypothetical protein
MAKKIMYSIVPKPAKKLIIRLTDSDIFPPSFMINSCPVTKSTCESAAVAGALRTPAVVAAQLYIYWGRLSVTSGRRASTKVVTP